MAKTSLMVGSLSDALSLRRGEWILERLRGAWPETAIRLQTFPAGGETEQPDKRRLTEALWPALKEKRLDLVVCDMRLLPATLPTGLMVVAVTQREGANEKLVSHDAAFTQLAPGLRIGVAGPLQRAQLQRLRTKIKIRMVPGGADALMHALDARAEVDAIVLSQADLVLLGKKNLPSTDFALEEMLPPLGEGVTALVGRIADRDAQTMTAPLHDTKTEQLLRAERSFLREIEGEGFLPLGCLSQQLDDTLEMNAVLVSHDGERMFRTSVSGRAADPETVGVELANQLVLRGSRVIAAEMAQVPEDDEIN